jgi:hypothetical protein
VLEAKSASNESIITSDPAELRWGEQQEEMAMEFTSKKQSFIGKFVRFGVVGVAVATVGLAAVIGSGASSANAASNMTRAGLFGEVRVSEPGAVCVGVSGLASVGTPLIYARNTTNSVDAQWVRFRSVSFNLLSGQTIQASPWSAFSRAYDNRAAQFSGMQSVRGSAFYKVRVEVEFWNQTTRVGTYQHTIDLYVIGQVYTNLLGELEGIENRCTAAYGF